jgi:NADH-quinone oxidoreductase subunit J
VSLFTFAVLALLAVGSAAGMLLRRNPIHGALFLAINLSTVAALFLVLVALVLRSTVLAGPPKPHLPGGTDAVGRVLFTDYLFPFEVTSVLLLVAIVGVMALTKRRA